MTNGQIIEALIVHGSETALRCRDAVREQRVTPLFPPVGKMTCGEARNVFAHRRATLTAANISFQGLDTLLDSLAKRSEDETLLVAGFTGNQDFFGVLVDTQGAVVGCFRFDRLKSIA